MANETMTRNEHSKNTYTSIKNSIITAQRKVYNAVNSAMEVVY